MGGHGGISAGSYLADPTSPIPSHNHCTIVIVTSEDVQDSTIIPGIGTHSDTVSSLWGEFSAFEQHMPITIQHVFVFVRPGIH